AAPPETYGETIVAVCRVLIEENGERLIDPRDLDSRILFAAAHPWTRFPRTPFVRETVARMLAAAPALLPLGRRTQIDGGDRAPARRAAVALPLRLRAAAPPASGLDRGAPARVRQRLGRRARHRSAAAAHDRRRGRPDDGGGNRRGG